MKFTIRWESNGITHYAHTDSEMTAKMIRRCLSTEFGGVEIWLGMSKLA